MTTLRIEKEEAMNQECIAGRGKTENGMILDEIARKHHLKRIMCHMYRLKLPSS